MSEQCTTHILKEGAAIAGSHPILPATLEQTALKLVEAFNGKVKSALGGQKDEAIKLVLNGHVIHKHARTYSVLSKDRQHSYMVNLERSFCTCRQYQKGQVCVHRVAAYLAEQSSIVVKELATEETHNKTTEQPPAEPPPHNSPEEALEKARLALNARSQFLREAIIYAVLVVDGMPLRVEVLNIEGDVALVRALPTIKDDNLVPQFPFPEKQSAAQVIAKSLSEVSIYR
jgi:hypothetical protein